MKKLSRFGKYVTAAIFLFYIILSLTSFCVADEQRLIDTIEDDAYYYFKVARNVSDGKGLTFDGTTLTNGFHPLWMLTILPIFAVSGNSILCLRLVGVLSVLLTGMTGYLGFRKLLQYPFEVFVIPSVLFLISVVSISNTGMETAILLPLMLTTLLTLETKVIQGEKIIQAGVLLGLSVLARLDAIILVFLIALLFIGKVRRNLWIAIIPGLVMGVYLSVNLLLTGHLIPTSGVAKSMSVPGQLYNPKFLHQLVSTNNPVDGNLWVVFALAFLLSSGLIFYFTLKTIKSRSLKILIQNNVQFVVAGFFVAYTLYYFFRSSWVLWRWYSYPLVLFSIFTVPFLLETIFTRLESNLSISSNLKLLFSVACLMLTIFAASISFKGGLWFKTSQPSFKYSNFLAVQELNSHLPTSSTLAMGDRAGSVAYFSDNNVLQLEGLLGDYEILRAIQENNLSGYMNDFGVNYVISYSKPPTDYERWVLYSPLSELTSGPIASIPLCKEDEYAFIETQYGSLYVWEWPSCRD